MRPAPPAADRRRFLKIVGLIGVSSALGSAVALAKEATPPGPPGVKRKPEPLPPAPAAADPSKPPEISEDARALAAIVERRYGKHLDPKQLEAVTRELEQRIQLGQRLRAAKLLNRDEPDVTFKA